MSWVSVIKDYLDALSIPVTAYFGYKGVVAWREQMRGKDKYLIAKNLLKSIYRIRENVEYVRSSFFTSGEMATAVQKHFPDAKIDYFDKTEEDDRKIDAAVFHERWAKFFEVYPDYEVIKYEAIVHWGNKIEVALSEFEKLLRGLKTRTDMYPRLKNGVQKSKDEFGEYIFGTSLDGKDDFKINFEASIKKIELLLKPEIA